MFITNHESLDRTELFPCKSLPLMKFLCEHVGLNFIAREDFVEEKDGKLKNKHVWFFVKTAELQLALKDWAIRKQTKNMLFPTHLI